MWWLWWLWWWWLWWWQWSKSQSLWWEEKTAGHPEPPTLVAVFLLRQHSTYGQEQSIHISCEKQRSPDMDGLIDPQCKWELDRTTEQRSVEYVPTEVYLWTGPDRAVVLLCA